MQLVGGAFPGGEFAGLRANVELWVDLRNRVAHRCLPALDVLVIPEAQAGLLNFENGVVSSFGVDYTLGGRLAVPLQLSGFRDPDVLRSIRALQSALPPDVQQILSRAETVDPELLADPTFQLRVAFLPIVPSSTNSPDAVAYFVKPGEVPSELADSLSQYVVLPKAMRGQKPSFGAKQVVTEVSRRSGTGFNVQDHLSAARHFGVRPQKGEDEATLDDLFAEYFTVFKNYLYTQRWIDRLVKEFESDAAYSKACGRAPRRVAPTLNLNEG